MSCCCKPCVYESTGTCVPPGHCTAVHTPAHSSILQQTTSTDNFLQQKHNVVLYKNPTFHKSVYICQQLLISSMGTTGYPPYIIADHPSFNFIRKKRMQRQTEVLHKWRTRDRAVWTVVVSMSRVQAHCFCRCCDTHVSTTPTYHHPVRSTNNCFFLF